MFTKEKLKQQMKEMGLKSTDTVVIHTSFKSVGQVENGVDGFIDAFCEYLCDGLFMIPTLSWQGNGPGRILFDVNHTPTWLGAVPEGAAFRKDGIRSLHPTHSLWAHGKEAAEFIQNEENVKSPGTPGFCWDRLAERNAKIVLIGVGNDKNTFIHSVDERAELPDRVGEKWFTATIIDHNGNEMEKQLHSLCCSKTDDVSRYYVNFEKPLSELGAMTFGILGNAKVKIVDARKCQEIVLKIYQRSKEDIFTEFREIPEELYK